MYSVAQDYQDDPDKYANKPSLFPHDMTVGEWERKKARIQRNIKRSTGHDVDIHIGSRAKFKRPVEKRDDRRIGQSPPHLRHEDYRQISRQSPEWKTIHTKIKNQTHDENVEMMNRFGNYLTPGTYSAAQDPHGLTPDLARHHRKAIKHYGKRLADIRYDEQIQGRSIESADKSRRNNSWQRALEHRQGRGGTIQNEIGKSVWDWNNSPPFGWNH